MMLSSNNICLEIKGRGRGSSFDVGISTGFCSSDTQKKIENGSLLIFGSISFDPSTDMFSGFIVSSKIGGNHLKENFLRIISVYLFMQTF